MPDDAFTEWNVPSPDHNEKLFVVALRMALFPFYDNVINDSMQLGGIFSGEGLGHCVQTGLN
jgi:hypothetical protein